LPELKLALLSDHEIFNRYEKRLVRKFKAGIPFTSLFELNEGDYVVHLNHGIGRYSGLKHMKAGTGESDYLSIEYRDGAKLYVPVEGLDLVQKYVGMQGRPPALSVLGGRAWSKTRERTRKAIKDMAAELLKLQARRQVFKGYAFSTDTDWQKEFEEAFIYEETSDQRKTIQEVKKDMESPYPMDRLILGDVGYGKTEVAMRAAFKTVMNDKQVACLVPTTLLSYQHYNTFSERMADYPVTIKCLSRFESRLSQKKIIGELARGKVDIVIGTHRLLQKDVSFKNLGLIIIDEEQRFGVIHKEKVRRLSALVDCITLSATPIPRTFYMGLAGLRYISLINTPPEERLPIETFIINFDRELIRRVILRELERDGQTFIIHNRIDTIYAFSDMIKEIVPEANIAIAHGRMSSAELEEVMIKFFKKDIDVLISTTIIASGLDIPNANTIIVDQAHTFGLADLYQLRGRVGRFRHRAYAFFIIPKFRSLSGDARRRLKAIEDFTELGSGFKLALRDLEIRGAGNLLGPQQHGFIAAVGFDLYCELLQRAVSEFKGEKTEEPRRLTFELGVDFSLPPDYVPGVKQRLDIYRKMAMLKNRDEIKNFEEELADRFGKLPDRAGKVIEALEVKDMARRLGIIYLGLRGKKIILKFSPEYSMEVKNLNRIEEDLRRRFTFGKDYTIFIRLSPRDKDIIPVIGEILSAIENSHLVINP
jgi:transcription-repair coupling factor (superfamily II helicase)